MRKFKMIREAMGLDDGGVRKLDSLLEGDWSDEQWGE